MLVITSCSGLVPAPTTRPETSTSIHGSGADEPAPIIAVSNPTPSSAHAKHPRPLANPQVTTAVFFFDFASMEEKIRLLPADIGGASVSGVCGASPNTSENG